MKLSFKLEHTDKPDVVRGLVFNTTYPERRPVTLLYAAAEGSSTDVLHWFTDHFSNVALVRLPDGSVEEPDCLTVFEAAEAAMVPYQSDP